MSAQAVMLPTTANGANTAAIYLNIRRESQNGVLAAWELRNMAMLLNKVQTLIPQFARLIGFNVTAYFEN